MVRKIDRGSVVLADDPYKNHDSGGRPFLIVSDESYPFYPNGYLGVPLTKRKKSNTYEFLDYDKEEVYEEFEHSRNFVNPYSPVQVNEPGRVLCKLDDSFVNLMADKVNKALGFVMK